MLTWDTTFLSTVHSLCGPWEYNLGMRNITQGNKFRLSSRHSIVIFLGPTSSQYCHGEQNLTNEQMTCDDLPTDLLTYVATHIPTFIYLHRYLLIYLLKVARCHVHNVKLKVDVYTTFQLVIVYAHVACAIPTHAKPFFSRKGSKYHVHFHTRGLQKEFFFVGWAFEHLVVATSNSTYNWVLGSGLELSHLVNNREWCTYHF